MNIKLTMVVKNSATTKEIHTPSNPHIKGKISMAAICKTKVLKNESSADITPLFNAVKNEEPKIEYPANKKLNEKIKNPRRVMPIRASS